MAEGPIILTTGARPRSWVGRATSIVILLGLVVALPLALTLRGCDDTAAADVQSVKIGGQWFHLELAAEDKVRMKGLGQRTHIEDDGGMLFAFPTPHTPNGGGFVMRDCPIDIDIIYLDGTGRVGNWYAMKKEDPRRPDEGSVGDTGGSPGADAYEARLHKYEPRYAYQFAIELKGGTIENKLKGKLKEGDKIDLPLDALKRRAR